MEIGERFLGALAGAGHGEARAPTSGVAFTQLLLASVLSDTASLPYQGEGCRSSHTVQAAPWHGSRHGKAHAVTCNQGVCLLVSLHAVPSAGVGIAGGPRAHSLTAVQGSRPPTPWSLPVGREEGKLLPVEGVGRAGADYAACPSSRTLPSHSI